MLKVADLKQHPKQAEIYGETEVDEAFVASIQDQGVLQPLLVSNRTGDNFVISGHRRLMGSSVAQKIEVPCVVKTYKSEDEEIKDLIISNYAREKTNWQRLQEFLKLKQIVCQITKAKQGHSSLRELFEENESLGEFARGAKIDFEKPMTAFDILKNITGLSEYEQKMNTVIFDDDYVEEWFEKLRKLKLPVAAEQEIYEKIGTVRGMVNNKQCSLNEAATAIKKMFADIESKLKKEKPVKQQKAKSDKPKAEKPVPQSDDDDDEPLDWLTGISYLPRTFSQSPATFEPDYSDISFILKTQSGHDVGLVRTRGVPTGLCISNGGEDYLVNLDNMIKNMAILGL